MILVFHHSFNLNMSLKIIPGEYNFRWKYPVSLR